MTLLVYENSWEGFLSAVFEAFKRKDGFELARADCVCGVTLFERAEIAAHEPHARRVQRGMDRLGDAVAATAYQAWLSEKDGIENSIVMMLKRGFGENTDPLPLLMHPEIRAVVLASRHVGREAHRFLGLTRLKHVHGDLYAADFTHDYNLLPLMGEHFCARFGDQRIVIRDAARRQALVTGRGAWEIRRLPEGEIAPLPPDSMFEDLWRSYFDAIANPARKNLKLQQKFVPLKYRAHLTEFQGK